MVFMNATIWVRQLPSVITEGLPNASGRYTLI